MAATATRRECLAWALCLPLVLAGSLCAHALAYRLEVPDARERARLLAETGHGYLGQAPLLLALAAAVGFLLLTRRSASGRSPAPPPAWAFAVLPPLAFALQEHLERWIAEGSPPLGAVLEPTFLPGLALQLPFALLAYALARLLLRAARRVGHVLAGTAAAPGAQGSSLPAPARAEAEPRRSPLTRHAAERGPPALAVF